MKKKLPLTFTYDEVATILKVDRRTIYNLVGNEVSERKPLKRVGAKSGFRATITSDSVLQMFIKKYEVNEEKAVESILDRLHGKESSEEAKVEKSKGEIPAKKTVKPTDAMKSTSDISSGKELHGEAPDASDGKGTPATIESDQCYIYSGSSMVDGNDDEVKIEQKRWKAPTADKNGIKSGSIWMYTFPFNDSNPEFGILPKDFMSWSTPEDPTRRLDFIADKFDEDPHVESLLAACCRSEGGYPHFHVVVKFDDSYKISTVFHKPGNNPNVLAVQKMQLLPDGRKMQHKTPTQGIIDYIMAEGKFESRKNEECTGWTVRGDSLFETAEAEKKASGGTKTEQLMNEVKSGKSRIDILAQHPYLNNPGGLEKIRTAQQAVRWEKMGRPEKRRVRVLLVLGDVRTGKTKSVYETLSEKGIKAATLSEQNGLETYEAQRILVIDRPNERWCPYDLLVKLLSSNIVSIPVRTQGFVMTLWDSVVIETKSISELLNGYRPSLHSADRTCPENVEDVLKYVDKIRYCFRIETRELRLAFEQDGYSPRSREGVNSKLDYIDIPVERGLFRTYLGDSQINDELVRKLARMYFDVTRYHDAEFSPELDNVIETEEDKILKGYTSTILYKEYYDYGRDDVITAYLTACQREARRRDTE